ncbi:MAG: hypothetical protein ACR2KJ_06935 [Jatrophihabitans sp.]
MTPEEFAQLTTEYVAATKARLKSIRPDLAATPEAVATYRQCADKEWELGQAWDTEMLRASQS